MSNRSLSSSLRRGETPKRKKTELRRVLNEIKVNESASKYDPESSIGTRMQLEFSDEKPVKPDESYH